ncbi:MAG TPA: uroporphyrinogen decarboxylase family protein, partial [Rectinemataceae bacterium]|nr:uroporphyrinogen decarboxylase family protein [Rectinemataceae bacterium]
LCGTTVTGIATGILAKVLGAKGLPTETRVADTVQGISAPPPELLLALGSDTLRVGMDRIRGGLKTGDDGSLETVDSFGVLWRRAQGQLYYSQASAPLFEGRLSDALEAYRFPEPELGPMRAAVERGRLDSDRLGLFPILDRDCAGLLEMSARLRGTERLYLDMYDDPEGVEELAERLLEYKLAYWQAQVSFWGAATAGIAEADDYGSEISLLISPHMVRRTYIGRYARLFSAIRSRLPDARIVFHCCGAIREIIGDLIEAGVDALNPVQYAAAGMEPAALKRDFGDRLSFWGGAVDTKRVLPLGSPAEVRAELLRNAAALGPGGGWVISAVHNIQEDVPLENALAFLDAVAELKAKGEGR